MIRRSVIVGLALLAAGCQSAGGGGDQDAGATTLPLPTPSAGSLEGIADYLADHGVACARLEIENRGETAALTGPPERAMCTRDASPPLELLRYSDAGAVDRERAELADLGACPEELSAMDGAVLVVASGQDFDVRVAGDEPLSPASLASLNDDTTAVAKTVGLPMVSVTLRCSE